MTTKRFRENDKELKMQPARTIQSTISQPTDPNAPRLMHDIYLEKPVLFMENFLATEKIVVNQGGTSSGKTYCILDMLFLRALQEPNIVITVVGQDMPNLKVGAYRDAKNIRNNSNLYKQRFQKPNETDKVFLADNGSIVEFKSYGDAQDAHSGKRDYLFVNEANGISYEIYQQLAIRTYKQIYLDYNPSSRFWVHEHILNKENVLLLISDHRHNNFLTQEMHDEIENIADENLWRVYARGQTGRVNGLVYQNWELCDNMPQNYKARWGAIDFGFTNDPTAILDIRLAEGQLWVDEVAYETGLTNPMIARKIKNHNFNNAVSIVADSAEPKSIAELTNMQINIEPAQKGPDSVLNGIDILQRYKLNITRRSRGIIDELGKYSWKKNSSGNFTNQPKDNFNHALDALRYVALNKLRKNKISRSLHVFSPKLD